MSVQVHESRDHEESIDVDLAATLVLDSADIGDLAIGDTDVGPHPRPSGAINDKSVA